MGPGYCTIKRWSRVKRAPVLLAFSIGEPPTPPHSYHLYWYTIDSTEYLSWDDWRVNSSFSPTFQATHTLDSIICLDSFIRHSTQYYSTVCHGLEKRVEEKILIVIIIKKWWNGINKYDATLSTFSRIPFFSSAAGCWRIVYFLHAFDVPY